MLTDEILTDLQATKQFIVGEVTERADDTPLEEAVELVDELRRVADAVRDAITMLNGSVLKQLEGGSRQIGTRVFAAVDDSVKRSNHSLVGRSVVAHALAEAVDKETGEISPKAAADIAVNDMMHLYVSPAKVATTKGLKRIGASPKSINAYELKGKVLRVVDLAMPKDDDEDE